ncbi:CPBP family intramembrane metalloprotease [Rhodocytophaga rosea]|uniref:CPBP family intramembrane metalloprotease n=1 Tax=Rhodocytophaga rosea TaxID=2704465 RepID=A0A6C0GT02_9BACT|nr:CPBP family intramembrane glutamic endopeptidase [Rhodocytophaga rosea]QHT71285.1 CPBP family intramembrane metalloprotease [Rhodocytophaga rosea]
MKSDRTHTEPITPISDKRRIVEIIAVLCTGVGKFIFMDALNWKLPFIITAIIGWSMYIAFRYSQHKGILAYWGFRMDNFKKALRKVLPFGIVSVIGFVVIGAIQGTLNPTWHILPILIIYPIWGTIQQFLLIGLVAGNGQDLNTISIPKIVIILLAALLFAGVHYPNYWLIAATFVLALFYGYIYLQVRNVYVLGLFHGWVDCSFTQLLTAIPLWKYLENCFPEI